MSALQDLNRTGTPNAAPEPAVRPARGRKAVWIGLVAASVVVVSVTAIYADRRQIARQAVGSWLAAKGVESESQFAVLEPGRLAGRLRIGPPGAPDLVVDRAEVRYSLMGLVRRGGLDVTEVRLTHPVMRARIAGGRFSAGELDRLIEIFLERPPKPGEPHPRILIENGDLALASDYGPLRARVSARIEDARLVALDARTAPGRFAAQGLNAELGPAVLSARTEGALLSLGLSAPVRRLTAAQGELRDGALTLTLRGPYPDPARPGPISGEGAAQLWASAATGGGLATGPIRLVLRAPRLAWRGDAGDGLTGEAELSGEARDVVAGALSLAALTADGRGRFALGAAPSAQFVGRAQARGGWTGLPPARRGDAAELAAVKRALRAFRVSADGLAITAAGPRVQLALTGPVRLSPDAGGEARLTPQGGGYRLAVQGGGLPQAQVEVRRVVFTQNGLTAEGAARLAGAFGPVKGGDVALAGVLTAAGGQASFAASRCVEIAADRISLGENDVRQVSAQLCPTGRPLLRIGAGGWTLAAKATAAFETPFLQVVADQASGAVSVEARGDQLTARAELQGVRVTDTAPAPRFLPLMVAGRADLAGDVLTGAFEARLVKGGPIGRAAVRHDLRSGEGSAKIATGALTFAPGGLQPADLSPLAEAVATAVDGTAEFTGVARWGPGGAVAGEGRLVLPRLDFKSVAGQVSGLSGEIAFTSLAPLLAPPGQVLRARRIEAPLPLSDVTATLGLADKTMVVTGGEAKAGGGQVQIEHLEAPLEPDRPLVGAFRIEDVQLHDLVEATPFGDRVDLDARVSGRLPFVVQGEKIVISGGDLHAVAPGRLSISREALTGLSQKGAGAAPAAVSDAPTDTISDFAYQALENLAFSKLDAGLESRPDGRLGVQFHILGRHDPPRRQEIAISWTDLIRRRFLGRKLPLPSDTGVDLTLDTTLNLNELVRQYGELERLRSSSPARR